MFILQEKVHISGIIKQFVTWKDVEEFGNFTVVLDKLNQKENKENYRIVRKAAQYEKKYNLRIYNDEKEVENV